MSDLPDAGEAAREIWRLRPAVTFVRQAEVPISKWINLSHLLQSYDEGKRQRLWARIKARNPALAALLQDPPVFDLVRTFNATLYVEDTR